MLIFHCINKFIGSSDAWKNLAAMYLIGDGVPKSEVTAKEIMRVMFKKEI